MDKIAVNIKPYVGEYPFDIAEEPLTTLEWRWVKRISGYLPMTVDEGLAGGDPDLFCAFAVIALVRAGKVDARDVLAVADRLAAAPFDGTAIQYIGEVLEEEGEADPQVPADEPEPKTSSGTSSPSTSASPDSLRLPTGAPGSERSAVSARLTSVS